LNGTTDVAGAGIGIQSGTGILQLSSNSGSLNLRSSIFHNDRGDIAIDLALGGLTMNTDSSIFTNIGDVNLVTRTDILITQIRTEDGTIDIRSREGSVQAFEQFLEPNIISSTTSDIFAFTVADFIVQSDDVRVYDQVFLRNENQTTIEILLVFVEQ